MKTVEVVTSGQQNKPARTLLVDDERDYVFALSNRLRVREIVSDIAYDGFEALQSIHSGAPDVIVLDLRMPGIDGVEVLRRVRRDYPQIQVIVVTGHGNAEDERVCRELGAFDYLQKPVDIKVLSGLIRKALAGAVV